MTLLKRSYPNMFHVKHSSTHRVGSQGTGTPLLPSNAQFGANRAAECAILSRATARHKTQSKRSVTSSALLAAIETFVSPLAASFKKTAFRWCDSTSVIEHSGRSTATGNPGKPAPDPRSAIFSEPGGRREPRNNDSA